MKPVINNVHKVRKLSPGKNGNACALSKGLLINWKM